MAGMKSPQGGLVISGKRYPSGAMIPEKYHRQLEPTERRRDPAFGSELGVPNMGRAVVPHVLTFSGLMTGLARTYRYSDEAMRHSVANAHMMLNDPMIAGPLLARQHMTALLNWSVESEDEKDPKLKAVANELTNIISRTPRFTEYRRCLLEAIWYGRYAIQNLYGFHSDRDGNRRRVIADWVPVSGDKLLFRFDDGSGDYDRNQIGLKVSASMASKDFVAGRRAIEATGEGLAYFLEKWERKLITLHRHYIRDGEFEDPRSGGQVHGVGLRHFLYWIWYQKQEAFAQVAEIVERTGMGFIIYFYPSGNAQAREEVEKISREQAHTNTILMPAEQDDTYRVEQIPPNTSGLQVLLDYIENYLGDLIVRFILGQTLSSKPSATGMNTGVADLQKDSLFHIIRYDAVNLEETLTRELLLPNRDFNFPKYRNVDFFLRISTKVAAPEQELQALQQLWQMGAEIKTADIFDRLDLSLPDEDDQTLFNPQVLAAAKQFKDQLKNPQPPQMGGGMPPGAPPAPGGGMPPGAPPGGGMPPGQGGPPPGPGGPPPEQMDKEDIDKERLFGPLMYTRRGPNANDSSNVLHAGISSVEAYQGEVLQSSRYGVSELRPEGDFDVSGMEGGLHGLPAGHGTSPNSEAHNREARQRQGLQSGQLPLGDKGGAEQQSTQQQNVHGPRHNPNDIPVGTDGRNPKVNDLGEGKSGLEIRGRDQSSREGIQGFQSKGNSTAEANDQLHRERANTGAVGKGIRNLGSIASVEAQERVVNGKSDLNSGRRQSPLMYRKVDRAVMVKTISDAVKETDRNPTEAQRESGNYRKGKFFWHGLQIAIETPKGVKRRPEWPGMGAHYGYIKLTKSDADQDHIDVFVGPDPQSELVFCVDQLKKDGKTFDEHKILIGFTNEEEAKRAYLDSYSRGWKCGTITPLTLRQFSGWLAQGKTGQPVAHQAMQYARKVKSSSGQLSMFSMFDAPASKPQQSPNVGDTVYENGHVYQFNENHRWIGPIEEQPAAPQSPAAPEETPAEVASEPEPAVESQIDKEDTDAGRSEDEWQRSGPEGDAAGRDLRGQSDDGGDGGGRDSGSDRVKSPEERVVVARRDYTAPADRSLIPEGLQQSLSDHQQEGTAKVIASMNEVGGALLADSTGVGKTREMLAVGQYYLNQGKKVLVVAPMMVIRANWKKGTITGSWLNDSNAMGVPVHLTKDKLDPNAVNLTTYENLSKMKGLVDSDTVLIVEESQYIKNHDSARAKHAVEMSKRAHAVLFATATPIDKVQHLHYLERAGVFGRQWYGKTYEQLGLALEDQRTPNGYIKVWKQKLKSSEVMRRLSGLFDRLTQDGRMIRRELSMDGVPVTSHQLNLPQECHDAMNRIAQDIKSRGLGPGQERSQMLMHQRRQQEPYKVPHAVDMALEAMRDGRQVVIFASRVNESVVGDKDDESAIRSDGTMVLLKKAMLEAGVPESHIAEIHGGIAKDKIPNEMDRFQSSQARVVIATLESGGAGINLDDTRGDAPRTLIMMTAPFSAVDNMQGIGRVWRLKTQSVPHIHFLFGDTEVDEWNSGLIGKKMKTLGASVAGHVGKVDITELDEKDAIDYEPEDPYIWHYPGEGESPQASFSRLDNGDWGLKVEGTAKAGDEVQVTRKDGTKEIKRVSKVVKSAHGSTIVEFEKTDRQKIEPMEKPPEPPPKSTKQFSPEKKGSLLKALRMLAGDDLDRAMKKNDIGFNRFDGQLGHFLASMDELSDEQCEIAERLIVKYQRQVGPEVASVALKHEEQPAKPKREVSESAHPMMRIANWSDSKRMNTSRGERIVRTAYPDSKFWDAWRKDKESLKKQGISVGKYNGDWQITWWQDPNAEQHSRLRSMVLRYVKDHHPEFYAKKVKSSSGQLDLFGGGDTHPRAPVGGTTVGGEAYRGGEFVPAAKVAEVAAETGQSKQQVAQEIQKGEDPVFSLQGGVSKASGKPKPLEIESIKGQQQTMWRGLRTDMPGQRDFIEEAEAKEADARRAAAAKNPDHDEVVMSAVQNAIDTIFLEKAVPATEENCMRIAEGSVYEVISANGYEFTPQQIKLAEDEARHMASGDFYMHAQDQAEKKKPKLTFDEFRKQYQSLFSQMMKYKPNEIGSQEFADKMAALADQYPEWAEQVEDEGAPEAKSEWDESTKQSVNGIDVAKGRFGANRNRWGVIGGVSWGSTPEEAVQEHLGYLDRASKQAEKEKIRSSVIEKLKSGDYAPDDIRQVTAYRETQGGTNEVLGLLASAGVKLARAKEVLKKIGPSDTTEDGYPLYDVAKAFESARSEGHLGPQQNSKDEVIPGGLASGVNFDEFDPHELADGMLTEMEHTSDPRYALEIAADHLREFPDGIDGEGYYDRLAEMEGDDAEQYGKGPRHAPKGGIKIGGQQYSGGMWIPNEAMEAATPAELKELSERTGEPAEDEPESEPEAEPAKPKGKFDDLPQRMDALPEGSTILGWKKQGDQWSRKNQSMNTQEFLDYYRHPVHMHQILGELDNGPQVDLSGGENDNEAGGEDPAASNRGDAVDNDNVIDAEILGDGIVEAEVIDSTQAVQDVTSVARTFGIPLGDINNDRRLRLFLNRTARRLGFDPESVGNNPTRQAAASAKYLNSQIPYLDATTKWAEYYGWRGSSAQELAARAGNAGRFLVKYAEKAGLRTTGGRDDAADLRDALTFLSRSAWASAGKPQASNASSFDDLSKKVIGFGITWMLLNKLVSK